MPELHALLGPSSSSRWLACPPSARLNERAEDAGSDYAREGTLAHKLAELLLRQEYEGADVAAELAKVRSNPMYNGSMEEYIGDYVAFIGEKVSEARVLCPDPKLFIEQMVDLSEYIPESFGTADAIVMADGIMDVIDLKYGTGVAVSAENNSQMKIYALGCWLALNWAYQVDTIRMTIYQPRIGNISTATISTKELTDWAENVLRPTAQLAWNGEGEFNPGETQCRWCKASAICRARAEYQLELARYDFAPPPMLDNREIADILTRASEFKRWLETVEKYALAEAMGGKEFPGFKLVRGRSNRKYSDEGKIAEALAGAGYSEETLYKPRELIGITAMEKLVGKKKLQQVAGSYITKPDGAPVLVPESDKREAISMAAEDFKDVNE